MRAQLNYVSPPFSCGYLAAETARMEYVLVAELTALEYQGYLMKGWRRFGKMMFRPQCPACQECQSLRVDVDRFRPNRSQRRAWRLNWRTMIPSRGRPSVTDAKLKLYDRYHAHQIEHKGWPDQPPKDVAGYMESFVDNPSFTREWCYYLNDVLVGVGYVDEVPAGLSAMYFFHDPQYQDRSLGVFNILCLLQRAWDLKMPHVYLGYYVADCPSLVYKANYRPNQILGPGDRWLDFQE